jgi:hypothetical protein
MKSSEVYYNAREVARAARRAEDQYLFDGLEIELYLSYREVGMGLLGPFERNFDNAWWR